MRRICSIPFPYIVSFLFLAICGCSLAPPEPCIKNGRVYGETNDWIVSIDWDTCYRRGISYAEGGCWDQAMDQFLKAISQRPEDQWRVRTYGMHVLDEYFPHRELGIIYLHQGKLERAIDELTASLASTDSAKAKYFLNKARRQWLKKTGGDQVKPMIRFSRENDENEEWLFTNHSVYWMKGKALDDSFVSSIMVNDEPLFIDLAEPVVPFTRNLSLMPGPNRFLWKVVDLVGNECEKEVKVFLDLQGPMVVLSPGGPLDISTYAHEPFPLARRIVAKGIVFDTGGLDSLMIGKKKVPLVRGEKIKEFQVTISCTDDMTFRAEDRAGNVTSGDLGMIWETDEAEQFGHHLRHSECPEEEPQVPGLTRTGHDRPMPIRIAANGPFLPHSLQRTLNNPSGKGPRILTEQSPTRVFQPFAVIQGCIESNAEITEVWINDESLLSGEENTGLLHSLRRFWYGERTLLYFTRIIEDLKEGENRIVIFARDKEGRSSKKEIMVEYQAREIERIGSRWCLAILPFTIYPMNSPLFARPPPGSLAFLRDDLLLAFFQTHRFRLVERERIDAVMHELGLQSSVLIDESTRRSLGKLLPVEVLLVGSFREGWDGRERCLEIITRLIDVDTGEILAIKSAYNHWRNKRDEEYLLAGLAQLFQQEFPLVQGEVLEKRKKNFDISINADDLLKKGMKVLVYSPEDDLHEGTILGEARVREVKEDSSLALPSTKELLEVIQVGYLVITK